VTTNTSFPTTVQSPRTSRNSSNRFSPPILRSVPHFTKLSTIYSSLRALSLLAFLPLPMIPLLISTISLDRHRRSTLPTCALKRSWMKTTPKLPFPAQLIPKRKVAPTRPQTLLLSLNRRKSSLKPSNPAVPSPLSLALPGSRL